MRGAATLAAKVTNAFSLPSNHVIHTVGPIAGACVTADCALLENCHTSRLDVAANAACHSIAFCCYTEGGFEAVRVSRPTPAETP